MPREITGRGPHAGAAWLQLRPSGAETSLNPLRALYATPGEAFSTGLVLLAIGACVGAAGSAVAVRRFLDV